MRKLPPYEPLGVGPWSNAELAFHGMGRALQLKADELGGKISIYTIRRNGIKSYGARGEIRIAKKKRYFSAGVI